MNKKLHTSSRGNSRPKFGAKALAFVLAAAKLENPLAEMAMLRLQTGNLSDKQRIKAISTLEKSGTARHVKMLLEARAKASTALVKEEASYRENSLAEAISGETEEALATRALGATEQFVRNPPKTRPSSLALFVGTMASLAATFGMCLTNSAGPAVVIASLLLSTVLSYVFGSSVYKYDRMERQLNDLLKMDRSGLGSRSVQLLQKADATHMRYLGGAKPEKPDNELPPGPDPDISALPKGKEQP